MKIRSLASNLHGIARATRTTFAVGTLACATFALPAFAQSSASAVAASATARGMAHPGHVQGERAARHQHWQQERQQRREKHLHELHEKLALAPAQQNAWNAFAQAMQPQARDAAALDRKGMQQLSTPERIDRMRAMRAQRAAAMDARGDATKAFYAQLQPAQQQTFDQEHQRGMQRRHGMGQRHGGQQDGQHPGKAG